MGGEECLDTGRRQLEVEVRRCCSRNKEDPQAAERACGRGASREERGQKKQEAAAQDCVQLQTWRLSEDCAERETVHSRGRHFPGGVEPAIFGKDESCA